MKDRLSALRPRHSAYLGQSTLFSFTAEALESHTKVSRDEMRRWHQRGLLSFNPDEATTFDERHRIEIEFLAGLMRSGLSDTWIEHFLAGLSKPYCYDPDQTFYSFVHGQWVTLPSEPEPDETVQEDIDDYLVRLAEDEDWESLHDLEARVRELLLGEIEQTDEPR